MLILKFKIIKDNKILLYEKVNLYLHGIRLLI